MTTNFRPEQRHSPRPNSLYNATTTIDDLTLALDNFSRVPSPELPAVLECCCGKEDCANLTGWLESKSRLESRLVLSAEVGQALLQRHEAYVRRHEIQGTQETQELQVHDTSSTIELPGPEMSELVKEKAVLEKRLNQALVNMEVTEASSKTILHELQEARTTISRLTASCARSIGLENRLSAVLQEKDDMQQERDSELSRAKLAESRLTAMKDKTAKLQSEVRRLQDVLEERRLHRLESSDSTLQDARARLDVLNKSQTGQTAMAELTALTHVLESLVNDNEGLKHDNAELQNLLVESREETHLLQQEVEEHRANSPLQAGIGPPHLQLRTIPSSAPSSLLNEHALRSSSRRSSSIGQRSRRSFEPLTPETHVRPLSPADSLRPSGTANQPKPQYPSSHISIEIEEPVNNDDPLSLSLEKAYTNQTSLLSRSRGVQTEDWAGLASLYPVQSSLPSSSPHDPRSESSSFSDSPSSNLSTLLERMATLHNRVVQADALTLANRLKRQHLKGADIGHLSRSTISNILSEVTSLRTQFRFLLEDDKIVTPCTRKDFRIFFKLFKDIFTDMGDMRVTLNDVILDPSIAPRVSEQALHLDKQVTERRENEQDGTISAAASGWMAPISKLFQVRGDNPAEKSGIIRSASAQGKTRPPPRIIPKLGPALSASAMTVNVEFSGTGVGRSTTSTIASRTPRASESASTAQGVSPGVMNIFAGAPRAPTDPWVVVPKGPRRVQSFMQSDVFNPASLRRSGTSGRGMGSILSREVDAVIDVGGPQQEDEETDEVGPLLQRTLRRRGLSDSSIHSTYTSHADEPRTSPSTAMAGGETSPPQRERPSVFQTLSRTVQSFRITAGPLSGAESSESTPNVSPQKPSSGNSKPQPIQIHAPVPSHLNLLPSLPSWAASTADALLDSKPRSDLLLPSSFRDQWARRLDPGAHPSHHDFF